MQPQRQDLHDRVFYLRRKFKPKNRIAGGLLEISPWIDVVLIVLLFFMVNSAAMMKPGVPVNLPMSPAAGGAGYSDPVVSIPATGFLFFRDTKVTEERLAELLRRQVMTDPDAGIVIEADEGVSYGYLMRIYRITLDSGVGSVVMATRVQRDARMELNAMP